MKLEDIGQVLMFRQGAQLVDRLAEDHLEGVVRLFSAAVSIGLQRDDEDSVAMMELVRNLSSSDVGRLIGSPRFYGEIVAIASGDTLRLKSLLHLLRADLHATSGCAVGRGCWTADCAVGLVSDHFGTVEIRQCKIHDCIVLDLNSDWTLDAFEARSGIFNGLPTPVADEERGKVVEKITTAMDLLDEKVPLAARIIKNFTRIIRVRFQDGVSYGSEQVPRELGAIRLLNPHLSSVTVVDLCDFILHESVHNMLSAFENRHGAFVPDDLVPIKYRPVSPWSGRAIPLQSFCHAVYVYFALLQMLFALSLGPDDRIDFDLLEKKIAFSARGFMHPPKISEYLAGFKVASNLSDEMDALQDCVRTQVYRRLA